MSSKALLNDLAFRIYFYSCGRNLFVISHTRQRFLVLAQNRHRNGLCFLQDPSRAPEFEGGARKDKAKQSRGFHEHRKEKRVVPML